MVERQPTYIATVRRADYKRFREINVDDDPPATFDDWEKEIGEKVTKLAAHGLPYKKFVVDLDDYAAFCRSAGLEQNSTTFGGYACTRD